MAEVDSTHAANKILAALRQGGMGWIADEVELAIHAGKLVDQTKKKLSENVTFGEIEFSDWSHKGDKKKKEELLEVEPLSDIEKLKITLRTIQQYVVGLNKTWFRAQAEIQDCLDQANLQVVITDTFTEEKVPLFEQGFTNQCGRIDRLLDEAWPEGSEPYDLLEEHNSKEIR